MNIKKYLSKTLSIVALSAMMVGCADNDPLDFAVDKPATVAELEYLNSYNALKTYIDRSAHPGFHLGVGVTAQAYVDGGIEYRLVTANFDEMTAGNAMKMASVVDDNGNMNFDLVKSFVDKARDAGITIYGHTLAWHEQQPVKYLNKLIADKEIEVDPDALVPVEDYSIDYSEYNSFPFYAMDYSPEFKDGMMCTANPGGWYQYFAGDGVTWVDGKEYTVTVMAQASEEVSFNVNIGDWGGSTSGTLKIGTEMKEYSVTITSPGDKTNGFVIFQPGGAQASINYKWLKVTHSEAPVLSWWTNTIKNSECNDGEGTPNFITRNYGQADVNSKTENGILVVPATAKVANSWDNQFFIYTPDYEWQAGQKVHLSFKYRADVPAKASTQCHGAPGGYIHWAAIGDINFTTEWQTFDKKLNIPGEVDGKGMHSIAFNLNEFEGANTYYFDDIVWEFEESGNTIPLTPEEKFEKISDAMGEWCNGMMQATEGYVTSWDVINEAISGGGNDGQGNYLLQTGDQTKFYWQDYLTPELYGKVVCDSARKAFARVEGANPADLKLFINDYNLESDWDDNHKLKSLINWIAKWEDDGVTRFDGIGSQMHISYYEDPDVLASKKSHIENMFKLMAATGKLVKISELDMGYVDEFGADLNTNDLTIDQHKAMAEYYKWIIETYFKLVPPAQQYGITQWCIQDAPESSGWRANTPVGLWFGNDSKYGGYTRKPAYAGFAEGLQSK